MITILPESDGDLLALRTNGKLTHADYRDVLITQLEAIVAEHGKARILCNMGIKFDDWELQAMWDDARFGLEHRNDLLKFAVIGGPDWVDWGARIAGLLMDTEVETFGPEEQQAALEWVKS
jgi:hypothetical protein